MLDTSTPKLGHSVSSIGRMFNRRNRRMWSRAIWGLKLPGRYWFLTLTTTPDSPELEKVWDAWRKWMKRYRPSICWLYCLTTEGEGRGVIHMVVRLGMKTKRLDAKTVRSEWKKLTGAKQIKIRFVPESKMDDLAAYLAGQKRKAGLAKEMGYQSAVRRWRWSKGWLPKGFTKLFGRAWVDLSKNDVPMGLKLKRMSEWLQRYKETDGDTWRPVPLIHEPGIGWRDADVGEYAL